MTKITSFYQEDNIIEYFDIFDNLKLKSTNKLKIIVEFEPTKPISFVELTFKEYNHDQLLNISISLNKYRNCFSNLLSSQINNSKEFICEAISPVHYR